MELTLNNAYQLTYDARDEWRNILVALEMSPATINSIGMQWRDRPDDCYREGLAEWLKGDERDWVYIMDALSNRTVGHKALARKMGKEVGCDPDIINSVGLRYPGRKDDTITCQQWTKRHWIMLLIVVGLLTAFIVTAIILSIVLPLTLISETPTPTANTTTMATSSSSTMYQLNFILCSVAIIVASLL